MSQELSDVQTRVRALRRRLRCTGIDEVAHADARSSSALPDTHHCDKLDKQLLDVINGLDDLPQSVDSTSVNDELRSLRAEVVSSSESMSRIKRLARLGTLAQSCDNALSDLLEHVDSFPASCRHVVCRTERYHEVRSRPIAMFV